MNNFLNCYEKIEPFNEEYAKYLSERILKLEVEAKRISDEFKNTVNELKKQLVDAQNEVEYKKTLSSEIQKLQENDDMYSDLITDAKTELENYKTNNSDNIDSDYVEQLENEILMLENKRDKNADEQKDLEDRFFAYSEEHPSTEEDIDKIINSISETETKAADESQKYSLYIANLKKELKYCNSVMLRLRPKEKVSIRKNAILQNAYNIEETQELNETYFINFMMPGDDNKLDYIQPFGFVRYNEDGQLYRIVKRSMKHDDVDYLTVECQHVITTLQDTVMYGSFTYGGGSVKTADVINYILGMQPVKHWVLGGCDFDRRFEYTWKHETLLSALISIPKEFGEDYMWDYETTVYPWKLYLRKLDKAINPEFYIRAKRNLIGAEDNTDYTGIVTRIYALGAENEDGEQLTIESVNNGVPYVQADDAVIAKYGLIEAVLIDRRFENAESLKAYAQATLSNAIEPGVSRSFDVVDLYPITNTDIDNARVGALTRLVGDGTNVFITKTTRVHDQPGNLNLELSTKSTTLVNQIVDLARTVKVNSVYS